MMDKISSFYRSTDGNEILPSLMYGTVTNNNDPQQMGRVQAYIPSLSEHQQHVTEDHLPWISYITPFGGTDERVSRGPAKNGQTLSTPYGSKTEGPVCYGMWAIPKVGSIILIAAADNDPNQLCYLGSVMVNSTTHTLPHGRYISKDGSLPDGPLSTTEQPIEPLYTNSIEAFGDHNNFEWVSRGADYGASAVSPVRVANNIENNTNVDHTGTKSKTIDNRDTKIEESDGNTIGGDLTYRQGYALNRTDPNKETNDEYHKERNKSTDRNLESTVYSLTTPGFHSISMDDRPENCRAKFRTSSGHQILLDDTNERIYVSTNEGRNWIEMDSDGHIYIYSQESVSISAEGDLNLNAKKTIRIKGDEGVHIQTDDDFRVESQKNTHLMCKGNHFNTVLGSIHTQANQDMITTIDNDNHIHVKNNNNVMVDANNSYHVKGDDHTYIVGNCSFHVTGNYQNDIDGSYSFDIVDNFSAKSSNYNVDAIGNIQHSGDLVTNNIVTSGVKSTGIIEAPDFGTDTYSLLKHVHNQLTSPTTPANGGGNVSASGASDSNPTIVTIASPQTPDDSTGAMFSYVPNFVPQHEPWGRIKLNSTDNTESRSSGDGSTIASTTSPNNTNTPSLQYADFGVGRSLKVNGNIDRERNPLWHR